MTSSRTTLAFGITLSLLVPAAVAAGCGGNESGPGRNDNTGGAAGSGVAGSTTAGTAGQGTGGDGTGGVAGSAAGGSGGSGGTGGVAMTPYACQASVLASTAPGIADFSVTAVEGDQTRWGQAFGDAGTSSVDTSQLWGGIFQYGSDGAVTFSVTDEALVIAGDLTGYSGGGLWFGPCVDARAFAGIQFDVSGMPGDSGQITFMLQTNANTPITPADMRGACAYTTEENKYSDCAQPAATRPVSETVQTVQVLWTDLMGGKPTATTDGSDIVGMQFQFTWSDTAAPYSASITIDNVQFIPIE